jgi:hypothetical protein
VIASDAGVVFGTPSTLAPLVADADVNVTAGGGRSVEFKILSNAIEQLTAVVFTITNVTTPTKQLGSDSSTSITTYDTTGNIIGRAFDVATDAITVGALTGLKRVDPAVDTPAYTDTAVVSFTTAGSVPVGGFIRVVLPEVPPTQVGWVVANYTRFRFREPSTNAPSVTSPAVILSHGRSVELLLDAHPLSQRTEAIFTISNVTPPSAATLIDPVVVMTTMDSEYNVIDTITTSWWVANGQWYQGKVNSVVDGLATFTDFAVMGRLNTLVSLKVQCSFGTHKLVDLYGQVQIQQLTLRWIEKPPAIMIPSSSSASYIEPLPNAVRIELLNITGGRMVDDNATVCWLTAVNMSAHAQPRLQTGAETVLKRGVATWEALGIDGTMGTSVKIEVRCKTPELLKETYTLAKLDHVALLENLTSRWHYIPEYMLPGREIENNTLQVEILTHDSTRYKYLNPTRSAIQSVEVQCHLKIAHTSVSDGLVWLEGNSDTTVVEGIATFTDFAVMGPLNTSVGLIVQCSFGTHKLVDLYGQVQIQQLTAHLMSVPDYTAPFDVHLVRIEILDRLLDRYRPIESLTDMPLMCTLHISESSVSAEQVFLSGLAMSTGEMHHITRLVDRRGLVEFEQLEIVAPLGTLLELSVQCQVKLEVLPVIRHSLIVQALSSKWATDIPLQVSAYEPIPRVQVEILNHTGGRYGSWLNMSMVPIKCNIELLGFDEIDGHQLDADDVYLRGQTQVDIERNGMAAFVDLEPVAPVNVRLQLVGKCFCGEYRLPQNDLRTTVVITGSMQMPIANVTNSTKNILRGTLAHHFNVSLFVVTIGDFIAVESDDRRLLERQLATKSYHMFEIAYNLSIVDKPVDEVKELTQKIMVKQQEMVALEQQVADILGISIELVRAKNLTKTAARAAPLSSIVSLSHSRYSTLNFTWLQLPEYIYSNQLTNIAIEVQDAGVRLSSESSITFDIECMITVGPERRVSIAAGNAEAVVIEGVARFHTFIRGEAGLPVTVTAACKQRANADT